MGNNCGCGHDHDNKETDEHECCGSGCCGSDHAEEDACGCGHDHGHDHAPASPEEIAEIMKAIEAAGYKVEETPDGEIRILEK